jgi:hypothetical protein
VQVLHHEHGLIAHVDERPQLVFTVLELAFFVRSEFATESCRDTRAEVVGSLQDKEPDHRFGRKEVFRVDRQEWRLVPGRAAIVGTSSPRHRAHCADEFVEARGRKTIDAGSGDPAAAAGKLAAQPVGALPHRAVE